MTRIAALCLLLSLPFMAGCSADRPGDDPLVADLLIRNARIWTGDEAQPWASALAIHGDRILAVGADLDDLAGPGTEVLESPAGLVVPGFIDSHVHLMESGFELSSVQLRDAATPEEFAQRIAVFARTLAPGEWMRGGTWDHQNWGGELPNRSWVDELTPNTPILLMRLDGHMALANSKALELAGVDDTTADVAGGEIVRDAAGKLTGILKDNAMELVAAAIPVPGHGQQDAALDAAMHYLAGHGVTSVHDMGYNWEGLATYRRAHTNRTLRTRIYASVPIADWQKLAAEVDDNGRGDAWLRIGGVKGFTDGSLGSHTAAFFEPFTDTPDDSGFFLTEPQQMRDWVIAADAAGLQPVIHAIGDRANATLLDIFADAIEQNGPAQRRFRIEHAQHLRPAEIERIAALDVIPSMQPYHAIDDGRWADSVIGPQRTRYTYAFRSLLDAGARLTFGSDWSVAPASPLLGIYAATTRQTLDGAHPGGWVPEQKISVQEALAAYTRAGAYASYEEEIKGTLSPGKLADLVILNVDITCIPAADIRKARVSRTIVGGKSVFSLDD